MLSITSRLAVGLIAIVALSASATAQNTHIVLVGPNFSNTFEPEDLIICEGDTVTWEWVHGIHNVREVNLAFNSGSPTMPPMTFSVTFDTAFLTSNPPVAGFYDYLCDPHVGAGMVGTITVVDPRVLTASATGGATGTISVSGGIPGDSLLLGYSLAGNGPLPTPYGTLALSPPYTQLSNQVFDSNGDASLTLNVPAGASGATVHLHGLELFGNGTGVLIWPKTIVVL